MRIEDSVTSISWIPSESITGSFKVPFEVGLSHYDSPPPDHLIDLDGFLAEDRARFANHLRAYIDVKDGVIAGHGHLGYGRIGSTTLRLGRRDMTFAAVSLPDLRGAEPVAPDAVRFWQTAGGRTGVPAPRRVNRAPFLQFSAPLAWTTLSLTLYADGRKEFELSGASPFPRHWMYDGEGELARKSSTISFQQWSAEAFGSHTPWGDVDTPALTTEVETALERLLSEQIMKSGRKPAVRRLRPGARLTTQGEESTELYLLLDGMLAVEVDGTSLVEVGPGAVLGERAILEGGRRTATLTAVTACTVAVADRGAVDVLSLEHLSGGHRREETS
jgi:hypothetical protein